MVLLKCQTPIVRDFVVFEIKRFCKQRGCVYYSVYRRSSDERMNFLRAL